MRRCQKILMRFVKSFATKTLLIRLGTDQNIRVHVFGGGGVSSTEIRQVSANTPFLDKLLSIQ